MSGNEEGSAKSGETIRSRSGARLLWRSLAALAVIVFTALWLSQEILVRHLLPPLLNEALTPLELTATVQKISFRIGDPLVLQSVRVESDGTRESQTRADADRIILRFEPPWRMFFGPRRFIRSLEIEGLRAVIDNRQVAMPDIPFVDQTDEEQREGAEMLLRFLPLRAVVNTADITVIADDQRYAARDVSFILDERKTDSFYAAQLEFNAGPTKGRWENLEGITAWKNGTIQLADVTLSEGLRIDALHVHLTNPGGPSVNVDLNVHGGSVRGDWVMISKNNDPWVEAALYIHNVPLAPLPELLGLRQSADGLIRELRLSFRGNPEQLPDAESSLRVNANGVRIGGRGWDSLEAGINLIGRKLYLPNFELRQDGNSVRANGELALPEKWDDLYRSRFLVNVNADVTDLRALGMLMGGPLNDIEGRLSVHGSLGGEDGSYEGHANIEAGNVQWKGITLDSVRASLNAKGKELQLSVLDVRSGNDVLTASGMVTLEKPYTYNAEARLEVADLAGYVAPFEPGDTPLIWSGGLTLTWQGDGSFQAHSGAVQADVRQLVTPWTPSGLTAQIEGTYSPQNVYLRRIQLTHESLRLLAEGGGGVDGINARHLRLFNGNRELLRGEIYLPLNAFALARGISLEDAVLADRKVSANLQTERPVPLMDILQLLGQEPGAQGDVSLKLDIGGALAQPTAEGEITGNALKLALGDISMPAVDVRLAIQGGEGIVKLQGTAVTPGFDPIDLTLQAPFGLARNTAGGLTLPNGAVFLDARFPRTNLAVFRPFLPRLRHIDGTLQGGLKLEWNQGKLLTEGRLELHNGLLEISTRLPVIRDFQLALGFNGERIAVEKFSGTVGAGPFQMDGYITLENPSDPGFSLHLQGNKILLARDANLRLRANVDLKANGNVQNAEVSGTIRLVDGRIYRRLEILPMLAGGGGLADSGDDPFPISFADVIPAPWANIRLDLRVENETPFLMAGNIASGEIIPNLNIKGTLAQPLPLGDIMLRDVRAFLPFTTMTVHEGYIRFDETLPGIPILDVRGTAQAQEYLIQAYAHGPLPERNLVLRSDPPLPQTDIIRLLATGITPGVTSGTRFGEVAVGQGGILLLRALTRQFNTGNFDVDSFLNRLQVRVIPPLDPTEESSIMGEFRLWDNVSVGAERDGYGYYNAGAIFTYRFR